MYTFSIRAETKEHAVEKAITQLDQLIVDMPAYTQEEARAREAVQEYIELLEYDPGCDIVVNVMGNVTHRLDDDMQPVGIRAATISIAVSMVPKDWTADGGSPSEIAKMQARASK
jgi:hypothetical protein